MSSDYEGGCRSGSSKVRKNLVRLSALLGLAIAGLLPISVSAGAESGSGGVEKSLDRAVVEAMGVESNTSARSLASVQEEGGTQVNVMRSDEEENWAFGSAIIEAPKKEGYYPKGWLFVAKAGDEDWDVALEGSSEFSSLAAEAPEEVVSGGEKKSFADRRTLSGESIRTKLQLPWKEGRSWNFTGGPHGWNTGYDRPYAALDFAGTRPRDQKVKAAGRGRVYAMCGNNQGWIRVYHPNGYATDYYHLRKNIRPRDGRSIKRGRFVGFTGRDVSCGGAAYGRHVHFALLRGGENVALNNRVIGGWKFVQGEAYGGYVERGKTRRNPGSLIRNFGP